MAYKPKTIKTTVAGAITDAFSAIEELANEMRETHDNMEDANMGHMPKCEMAGAAADELENVSQPDDPSDAIGELEVTSTEMVNKDKRKGASRDVRLSNAKALLQDAIAVLNEATFATEELEEEAEELANDLEEASDLSVDFPGMFG